MSWKAMCSDGFLPFLPKFDPWLADKFLIQNTRFHFYVSFFDLNLIIKLLFSNKCSILFSDYLYI